jgi:hypothetical protein
MRGMSAFVTATKSKLGRKLSVLPTDLARFGAGRALHWLPSCGLLHRAFDSLQKSKHVHAVKWLFALPCCECLGDSW